MTQAKERREANVRARADATPVVCSFPTSCLLCEGASLRRREAAEGTISPLLASPFPHLGIGYWLGCTLSPMSRGGVAGWAPSRRMHLRQVASWILGESDRVHRWASHSDKPSDETGSPPLGMAALARRDRETRLRPEPVDKLLARDVTVSSLHLRAE